MGPASEFSEGSSPEPTYFGAVIQCDPHYQDWGDVTLLHVTGPAILPDSTYDIQFVNEGFDNAYEGNLTFPLTVMTGTWGDIIEPFIRPGLSQPDIADVLSIVDKWLGVVDPIKARAQLQPNIPNQSIAVGIADVLADIDAWLGALYPFDGPSACP